ncbi:hypothetical protein CA237_03590 [Sphingomonas sp. ABOLH]|nr:hypothetical protein CA237_03590 [Sphingomonas sp. ABOLH]
MWRSATTTALPTGSAPARLNFTAMERSRSPLAAPSMDLATRTNSGAKVSALPLPDAPIRSST